MKTTPTRLITLTTLFCAIAGAAFRIHATGPACSDTVQNPLDGGFGSLRFALANATNGETITFCPDVTGAITLTSGALAVTKSVTILGPGANVLTVNAGQNFRVFEIAPGNSVTIAGLTIANGGAPLAGLGIGGGIYNNQSSLTVSNCTLFANISANGAGGAIGNDAGMSGTSTVAVVNCTLRNNHAVFGGAIFNGSRGGHAVMTLKNSTLDINTASMSGGAIENFGQAPTSAESVNLPEVLSGDAQLAILNCTFNDNPAGTTPGGIHNQGSGGFVTIGSTILNASGFAPSPNPIQSLGYNLSSDPGAGYLVGPGDQTNTQPLLTPLQFNGGPTPTHAPLCGSPVIDQGMNFSGLATDQRGAPRTFDIPGIAAAAGGDGTDIGAVESPNSTFSVLNTNESGAGSLRQAILDANASPGTDLIEFNTNAYGTITLTNGELLITDCLILNGPGATNVAVNGNAASRVFHVNPGIVVSIDGLTITNGNFGSGGGGGILAESSTLTVNSCNISGNSAYTGGGVEGLGGQLMVLNSTISSNSASILGGGIAILVGAQLIVANSTISSNSAALVGGGIANGGHEEGGTSLVLLNSTLSGNTAQFGGGGIRNVECSSQIGSTILSASDIASTSATTTSLGHNLSSDNGGGILTDPTDLINTNPMLGPLQLNGGQTPTHALMCGSPAIDKGTNFLGLATDQRGPGFPRTFGAATDVGAFEVQQICNRPPVALCTNVTVSADSGCMATASIDGGSYDPDAGDTITLSQSPDGPYHLGTNIVTLTVTDNHGASNSCVGMVIVVDTTPPVVACRPAPSNGGKIPPPAKNPNAGNPTGYYEVLAKDNCDPNPRIYIKDTGSAFVAGPFNSGDIVRLRSDGNPPYVTSGVGPAVATINLRGNGLAIAKDAAGNTTLDASGCVMVVVK